MKNQLILAAALGAAAFTTAANADTIAYWNFNGLSIATASAPGSGGVPTSIASDLGTATLSLAGWTGTVDDFAGSAINAQALAPAEESLSLVASGPSGGPYPGNGGNISFSLNLSNYTDISVSFATRGTATGFNSSVWSYSLNGVDFTALPGSTATTSTTFALASLDFSSIAGIENQSSVTFRYTLSGATSGSGNNRIDNLLVSGTFAPIPEPSTYAAIFGGLVLVGAALRRRSVRKA